jgi:hypothetical protein
MTAQKRLAEGKNVNTTTSYWSTIHELGVPVLHIPNRITLYRYIYIVFVFLSPHSFTLDD